MFANLKIRTLIIAVLGFAIVMMLLVGGNGVYSVRKTVAILQNTSIKDLQENSAVDKIRFKMEINRSQILQALQHNPVLEWHKLHDHPLAVHYKIIADTSAEINKLWADYTAMIQSPEERKLADEWFAKSQNLGVSVVSEASADIQKDDWDAAEDVLIKKINPSYRVSDETLKSLTTMLAARSKANAESVSAQIATEAWVLGAIILVAAILSIAAGALLLRGITVPLEEAVNVARRVARGELNGTIDTSHTNEIGELLRALADMETSLTHIVRDVRAATDTISSASTQIATGNQELSSRTESQAGSLEQTASAMEELTGTVRMNGDNAQQANQLALSAAEVAGKGGEVVQRVVHTMGSINASANKIVDIIAVIDGIAFQTNILALNAAVEAARAGEQGRGFAVVASEVRNLAQRSAAAAKEIKTLIDDSVEQVHEGAKLVDQAGSTMHEIVSSVNRVTDIMSEITAASREQSEGIDHINEAISQMDAVTQQNASLVDQAAMSANALADQARSLVQLVSVFKLDELQGKRANIHAIAAPGAKRLAANNAPRLKRSA